MKKIIPFINAENEFSVNVVELAKKYYFADADEIFIYNYSKDEKSKEEFLITCREISKVIDIPFIIGIYVKRFEDIKKALYTGADIVMIKDSLLEDRSVVKEGSDRFGKDKIFIEFDDNKSIKKREYIEELTNLGVCGIMVKHLSTNPTIVNNLSNSGLPIIVRDSFKVSDIYNIISTENVIGIATDYFKDKDIMKAKNALKQRGVEMNIFESNLKFSDFKLNSEGLIPVTVQDYKTDEVLMLAYMNEEAFNKTIETGKMTYYSRSRNEFWVKGETSGHFQYLKELLIDCDNDTLLARVYQVGSACHTGNKTCFYRQLAKRKYNEINKLNVLKDVYKVIMDRKNNPREGSYTNYLFDKGIDKILKKCGEEAAEVIIAAKNPDTEELIYEISDFLYHLMVLMAECGIDWDDIIEELSHRR